MLVGLDVRILMLGMRLCLHGVYRGSAWWIQVGTCLVTCMREGSAFCSCSVDGTVCFAVWMSQCVLQWGLDSVFCCFVSLSLRLLCVIQTVVCIDR